MGHLTHHHRDTLVNRTAVQAADLLVEDGIDGPICNA
jgi:hypothetical protein